MFIYTLMESKNASQEGTFLGFTSRGIMRLASDTAIKRKKSAFSKRSSALTLRYLNLKLLGTLIV